MVNPLFAQPGMTCNAEEDMSDLRMGEKRSLERGRSLLPLPNMVNVLQEAKQETSSQRDKPSYTQTCPLGLC